MAAFVVSCRIAETGRQSKHTGFRNRESGNTDHSHWEEILHGSQGHTFTGITHGIQSASCCDCTVNKRTAFLTESPAFGFYFPRIP